MTNNCSSIWNWDEGAIYLRQGLNYWTFLMLWLKEKIYATPTVGIHSWTANFRLLLWIELMNIFQMYFLHGDGIFYLWLGSWCLWLQVRNFDGVSIFLARSRCGKVDIIEAIYNERECLECKIHVSHLSPNRMKAVDENRRIHLFFILWAAQYWHLPGNDHREISGYSAEIYLWLQRFSCMHTFNIYQYNQLILIHSVWF